MVCANTDVAIAITPLPRDDNATPSAYLLGCQRRRKFAPGHRKTRPRKLRERAPLQWFRPGLAPNRARVDRLSVPPHPSAETDSWFAPSHITAGQAGETFPDADDPCTADVNDGARWVGQKSWHCIFALQLIARRHRYLSFSAMRAAPCSICIDPPDDPHLAHPFPLSINPSTRCKKFRFALCFARRPASHASNALDSPVRCIRPPTFFISLAASS